MDRSEAKFVTSEGVCGHNMVLPIALDRNARYTVRLVPVYCACGVLQMAVFVEDFLFSLPLTLSVFSTYERLEVPEREYIDEDGDEYCYKIVNTALLTDANRDGTALSLKIGEFSIGRGWYALTSED